MEPSDEAGKSSSGTVFLELLSIHHSDTLPSEENARKAWIKLIQVYTAQKEVEADMLICSLHFTKDCFRIDPMTSKKTLNSEAVPSILPTQQNTEKDEFPDQNQIDFSNPEAARSFYNWCLQNHQEQKKQIKVLKDQHMVQAKRIARLAKSVDDFKAKRIVSNEANESLQNLFDKIIDAQYDVIC